MGKKQQKTVEELRAQIEAENKARDEMWEKVFGTAPPTKAGFKQSPAQREALTRILVFFSKGAGTVSLEQLIEAAKEMDVRVNKDMVAASLDGRTSLDEDAFADWWLNSKHAAAVLIRAGYLSTQAKRDAEAGVVQASKRPAWRPEIDVRARASVGADASFRPVSGIYLSALPSDDALAKEVIDASAKLLPPANEDETTPLDVENVMGVATVVLPLIPGAEADKVDEAVEMFNAVMEELTEQGGMAFPRMRRATDEKSGLPVLEVLIFVNKSAEDEPNPLLMIRMMAGELQKRGLVKSTEMPFEKILLGAEFGSSAASVFGANSTGNATQMLNTARVSATVAASDALCEAVEAAIFHKIAQVRGGRMSTRRKAKELAKMILPLRALRSANVDVSFRSVEEAVEQVSENVMRSTLAAGMKSGVKDPAKLAEVCQALKKQLTGAVPTDFRPEMVLSMIKGIGKVLRGPKTMKFPGFTVLGADSVRSAVAYTVSDPAVARKEGPQTIRSEGPVTMWRTADKDGNSAVVIELAKHAMKAASEIPSESKFGGRYVFAFDMSKPKEEQVALCGAINKALRYADIKKAVIVAATISGAAKADDAIPASELMALVTDKVDGMPEEDCVMVEATNLFSAAAQADPVAIVEAALSKLKAAGDDEDEDEDDDDEDDVGMEVMRTLLLALRAVTVGPSDVFYTDCFVDAHVELKEFPIFGWVPTTEAELDVVLCSAEIARRLRSEVGGVADMMELGMDSDDSDSDSDDDDDDDDSDMGMSDSSDDAPRQRMEREATSDYDSACSSSC